jgi:hypothetical protein
MVLCSIMHSAHVSRIATLRGILPLQRRGEKERLAVAKLRTRLVNLRPNGRRLAALALGAGALGLVFVPSAGFAIGGEAVSLAARGSFASFTPASINPRLVELLAERQTTGRGRLMRFTPASTVDKPGRALTVAVRVDAETAQAISVRSAISSAAEQVGGERRMQVAPVRYNLGLSRGYKNFAQTPPMPTDLRQITMPDLAHFEPSPGVREKPSRFAARIELEEAETPGRAPRTREALGDQTVGLGGSYRVTGNLDVMAGVRYSQERDRLAPLVDSAKDSQAVYVGTQFRF